MQILQISMLKSELMTTMQNTFLQIYLPLQISFVNYNCTNNFPLVILAFLILI